MPWKITNTVLDPSKAMLHRKASKLSTEPMVCGHVLRIRTSTTVSDEQYERAKASIDLLVSQGAVSVERIGGAPKAKVEAPAPEASPEPEALPEPPPAEPEPASDPETPAPKKGRSAKKVKKGKE
jgi:hypothetical protein